MVVSREIPEKMIELLKLIGETKQSATWDCHGTPVILHKAIEKIVEHLNITFDDFVFHELNSEDVTILLVTHEEEVARQAKRILKMKDGKIIEDQAVKVTPC